MWRCDACDLSAGGRVDSTCCTSDLNRIEGEGEEECVCVWCVCVWGSKGVCVGGGGGGVKVCVNENIKQSHSQEWSGNVAILTAMYIV